MDRLYETISFNQLDAAIVENNDATGTAQIGWRRERDQYFTIAKKESTNELCFSKASKVSVFAQKWTTRPRWIIVRTIIKKGDKDSFDFYIVDA